MFSECSEYNNILTKRETAVPFVLGEPPDVTRIDVCHQNKEDIGVALELEFPHIAVIKLRSRQASNLRNDSKCIGSLISDFHVITSVHCIHSDLNHFVTVQLGSFKLEDTAEGVEVEDIEKKYGIAILKLKEKVEFRDNVLPICLSPDQETSSQVLLAGWTGDWRECDPKLRKWIVGNHLIEKNVWQIKINESAILNYRQVNSLAAFLLTIYLK